jgi:MinD-like ATPase involved in chromosome partitioning or flagellar assembly
MPVVTFWSNTKKQTGQTMSLAAISTYMAIEHNYKILIISTKYNDNTLELCFGEMNKNKTLVKKLISNPTMAVDNGIEGLSKMAYSNRMTPDSIQNYTHVIYKNRLEVLYGYREADDRPTKEEYLKIKDKYKDIIQNASKYYDMVFVDLDKGLDEEMIKQVLKISDLIVANVEQKIEMIDGFNNLMNSQEFLKANNIILNIGRFDSYSKYSAKNISRYIGTKRNITVIPYNTLYFEAAGESGVADLFLKIRRVSDADRNANFIKEVKNAVEKIIYKLQELQMRM